jgi:hypothetical protein
MKRDEYAMYLGDNPFEVGNRRLLRLAEFLELNVPRRNFTMSYYTRGETLSKWASLKELQSLATPEPNCNSRASPLGFLPVVFPDYWIWGTGQLPRCIHDLSCGVMRKDLGHFFLMTPFQVSSVFQIWPFGGWLRKGTPKGVAKTFRRFAASRLSVSQPRFSTTQE